MGADTLLCVSRRKFRSRRAPILLLAAAPSLFSNVTLAANKSWTFNGSSTWSGVSNWQGGLPLATDDVFIISNDSTSRTVTLNVSTPALHSLTIGNTGSGSNTLLQNLNFNLNTASLALGAGATSKGALNQSNGVDTYDSVVSVGDSGSSAGTYTLTGGGAANLGTALAPALLYLGNSSLSSGTFSLLGTAVFNAFGNENIGYRGVGNFLQSGGTHALGSATASAAMDLGVLSGSAGTYSLSGGGRLFAFGVETIGTAGAGNFIQNGGTHNLGSEAVSSSVLYLGFSTLSAGTYALGNGTLNMFGAEVIGNAGVGSFLQSGGTHNLGSATVSSSMFLANQSGGSGTYLLSGSATLNVFGTERIGNFGTGNFVQNGGTHNLGSGTVTTSSMYLGYSVGARGT